MAGQSHLERSGRVFGFGIGWVVDLGECCRFGDVFLEDFSLCWEGLEDPRSGNASLHDFHEILMIALCSVLCGGQGAVDMALFAEAKEPLLREFLKLEHGVPSHDT